MNSQPLRFANPLIGVEIWLRHEEKFNPYHNERGRFTFAPGHWAGVLNGSDSLSDAHVEQVGGPPRINYDIILADPLYGGHTYKEHVGKSENYLKARIRNKLKGDEASSFPNIRAANNVISHMLGDPQFAPDIAKIAFKDRGKAVLSARFNYPTGYLYGVNGRRKLVSGARVVLMSTKLSPYGFYVLTAFPIDY